MSTSTDALRRAIEIIGSQNRLAKEIGRRQSHVWTWLNQSKHGVPAEVVLKIEEVTGGQVSRHDLRPDIYPRDLNRKGAA